jgi:hypothetical protein
MRDGQRSEIALKSFPQVHTFYVREMREMMGEGDESIKDQWVSFLSSLTRSSSSGLRAKPGTSHCDNDFEKVG